jgi:hypothetical protein
MHWPWRFEINHDSNQTVGRVCIEYSTPTGWCLEFLETNENNSCIGQQWAVIPAAHSRRYPLSMSLARMRHAKVNVNAIAKLLFKLKIDTHMVQICLLKPSNFSGRACYEIRFPDRAPVEKLSQEQHDSNLHFLFERTQPRALITDLEFRQMLGTQVTEVIERLMQMEAFSDVEPQLCCACAAPSPSGSGR